MSAPTPGRWRWPITFLAVFTLPLGFLLVENAVAPPPAAAQEEGQAKKSTKKQEEEEPPAGKAQKNKKEEEEEEPAGKKAGGVKKEEEEEEPAKTSKKPGEQGRASKNQEKEEEEEEPAKAPPREEGRAKKPKKEEEEEPARVPGKAPRREEEEDTEPLTDETRTVNLAAEAKRAPEGAIKDFYNRLVPPHDEVTMPSGRVDRIVPLSRYVGATPSFAGRLRMTRMEKDGKRTRLMPVRNREIKAVTPYEEVVLNAVRDLVKDNPDLARLRAAEKALVYALRFHNTTRTREPEDATPWAAVEASLRDRLFQTRLDEVAAYDAARKFTAAFNLAEQLDREHPNTSRIQLAIARLHLDRAEKQTDPEKRLEDFVAARRLLVSLEGQFSTLPGADGVRNGLKAEAERLMQRGKDLEEKGDKTGAIVQLRQATEIWPQLPGLQDKLRELDVEHPVLYVGVRQLPTYLSPATAVTDSELQAVELLFEGLVQPCQLPDRTWRYAPGLAEGRPQVVPQGREFHLARDAFWSDGQHRVSAADIRHTVTLLKKPTLRGRNTEWDKLVEDPRVEGNPYRIRITLRHGFLAPLSLMTFKVLPRQYLGRTLQQADDEEFAHSPLGSGPFRYQGTEDRDGVRYAVFTANPYYQRAGRPGRPYIREIRFFVPRNPAKDFADGRLQLLLDPPTSQVKGLRDAGLSDVRTRSRPRVYFLAANNGNEFLRNADLRKAIAHAIDREEILNEQFRAGYKGIDPTGRLTQRQDPDTEPLDPALNGPFPAGSWACAPASRVPRNLFNLELARNKAKQALAKVPSVSLTLKYPTGDDRVEKACKQICDQVARNLTGVNLKPVPLEPHEFRRNIFRRDYELAYCHYDYDSDAYWLWPLFDPDPNALSPGGSNYLRYQNDDVLQSLFRRAMNHRYFAEVKSLKHDIHARLYERMPLIPLWQLHTHIAVGPSLKPVDLDPLRVFPRVDEWRLETR